MYSPLLLEGLEASPVPPAQCLCQVDPLKTKRRGRGGGKSMTQLTWPLEWLHPRFVTEYKDCTSSLNPTSFVTFNLQKAQQEDGNDTWQCSESGFPHIWVPFHSHLTYKKCNPDRFFSFLKLPENGNRRLQPIEMGPSISSWTHLSSK